MNDLANINRFLGRSYYELQVGVLIFVKNVACGSCFAAPILQSEYQIMTITPLHTYVFGYVRLCIHKDQRSG